MRKEGHVKTLLSTILLLTVDEADGLVGVVARVVVVPVVRLLVLVPWCTRGQTDSRMMKRYIHLSELIGVKRRTICGCRS